MLQQVRPNAYVINIPPDHGTSFTFNVEELNAYKGHLAILDDPFEYPSSDHDTNHIPDPVQLPLPPTQKAYIDAIWMSRLSLPRMTKLGVS